MITWDDCTIDVLCLCLESMIWPNHEIKKTIPRVDIIGIDYDAWIAQSFGELFQLLNEFSCAGLASAEKR